MRRPRPSRRARRRLWTLTALAALTVASCAPDAPYDTLAPAGPVADRQRDLFMLVFWIATGVFVLVEGALVFIMFRFRRRRGDGLPKQVHGNTRLEVIWTILPALLLAGVAVPTVGSIFQLARPPANALEVEVVGHQWWWEVRYSEPELVTANEIHIPVDRPVLLTLRSEDVIHSFWVPRLAGKQDLVPGRDETLTIQASEPGTYLGECAEYCGRSHANMRFVVVAESQGDFEAWARNEAQPAVEPEEGSEAAEGFEVFSQPLPQGAPPGSPFGACIGCHTVEGVEGASAQIGPNLTHFGSRELFAAGTLQNTPEELARWLQRPGDLKPGAKMPDYRLTDEQIDALVAYLQSLE